MSSNTNILACYLQFTDRRFERGFFLGVVFLMYYLVPLLVITIFYTMIGIKVWKRNVAGIRGSKTERNIQKSKVEIVGYCGDGVYIYIPIMIKLLS